MYATGTLFDLDLRPVAARLGVALAASIALHGAAVLAFAVAPQGTLSGTGDRGAEPLQARIMSAPAAKEPATTAATVPTRDGRPRETAAATPPPQPSKQDHVNPADHPGQAFGVRPETVYYPASELDMRPRPTIEIDPAYPRIAPADGGYLVVELLIDETGAVDEVNVAIAEPEGFFEQSVIDAFAAARFTPGRRNGVAVKSRTWIEMRFHPLAPPVATVAPGPQPAAQ